jgi:hypothetical protein
MIMCMLSDGIVASVADLWGITSHLLIYGYRRVHGGLGQAIY